MKRIAKIERIEEKPKSELQAPMPSLITLSEFLLTLSKQRTNYFESLGGFAYWIRKEGCPNKWPFDTWMDAFKKFLSRKT
jgi:hypothetical protein